MLRRMLIAMLLVLAVPVQGLAAVSGGICMALNGHDAAHDHAAPSHEHDGGAAHEHESSDSHAGSSHCAPCVSCCAAVAIAPTEKRVLPEATAVAASAPPKYWIAGVVPDNPERPPLAL